MKFDMKWFLSWVKYSVIEWWQNWFTEWWLKTSGNNQCKVIPWNEKGEEWKCEIKSREIIRNRQDKESTVFFLPGTFCQYFINDKSQRCCFICQNKLPKCSTLLFLLQKGNTCQLFCQEWDENTDSSLLCIWIYNLLLFSIASPNLPISVSK